MSFVGYALIVYTYLVVDDFLQAIALISSIGMVVLGGMYLITILNESDEKSVFNSVEHNEGVERKYGRYRKSIFSFGKKVVLPTFLVTIILQSLYPQKSDLTYIIGGATVLTTADYVAGSEEAKRIPDNVLQAANKFLEDFNSSKFGEPGKDAKESIESVSDPEQEPKSE